MVTKLWPYSLDVGRSVDNGIGTGSLKAIVGCVLDSSHPIAGALVPTQNSLRWVLNTSILRQTEIGAL